MIRRMSFFVGETRKRLTLQDITKSSLPMILETGVYTFSNKIVPTLASFEKCLFRVAPGAVVTVEVAEGGQLGVDVYSPNLDPMFSLFEIGEHASLTIKGGTWGPIPHGSLCRIMGPHVIFVMEQAQCINFGNYVVTSSFPGCEISLKHCKCISNGSGLIGSKAMQIVNEMGKLSKLELECSQKKLSDAITAQSVERNDMYAVQAIHATGAQKITVFQCLFEIEVFPTNTFSAPTCAIHCQQCTMVDIKACSLKIECKYVETIDNRSEGCDAVGFWMEECSRVSIENILAPNIVCETGHASFVKIWKCAMAKLKTNTVEKIQAGSEHHWMKIPQVIVFYASECMLNLEDNSNKVLEMISVANPLFLGIETFPTNKGTLIMQPRRNF